MITPDTRYDCEILQSTQNMAHVGGDYYNPVQELKQNAKQICGGTLRELGIHQDRMNFSPEEETTFVISQMIEAFRERMSEEYPWVFVVYSTGKYEMAPATLYSQSLMRYEERVARGELKRIGIYLATDEGAQKGINTPFEEID